MEQYEQENISGRKMDVNRQERPYRKKNGELFWIALSIKVTKPEKTNTILSQLDGHHRT